MKKFKAFFFLTLLLVVAAAGFTIYNYHIVETKSGTHFIKKKNPGFEDTFLDTSDWKVSDYLEHQDVSIALAKSEWQEFKEDAEAGIRSTIESIESELDEINWEETEDSIKEEAKELKAKAEEQCRELKKKFEEGDINYETFKEKVKEVGDKIRKEIDSAAEKAREAVSEEEK